MTTISAERNASYETAQYPKRGYSVPRKKESRSVLGGSGYPAQRIPPDLTDSILEGLTGEGQRFLNAICRPEDVYVWHEISRAASTMLRGSTTPKVRQEIAGEVALDERSYITYSPSQEIVDDFSAAYNKALGLGLFRVLSGLTLSNKEATRLLEDSVTGALVGLSAILRQNRETGERIEIDNALRDLLIGGITTRLGRIPAHTGKRIAEGLVSNLEEALSEKTRLEVDGASVYLSNRKLRFRLSEPVTLNEIVANSQDWVVRTVSL